MVWLYNISDVAWSCVGVQQAELPEVPENSEVFPSFLRLLLLDRPSQEKKGV